MFTAADESWLRFFPENLRRTMLAIKPDERRQWQEIRLRSGQPIAVLISAGEILLRPPSAGGRAPGILTLEDVQGSFQLMTQHSVYALEEELKRGFITLPGGHRLGFTGHAVLADGRIKLLRQVSSLNLRLARAFPGTGRLIAPHLVGKGAMLSTLILSPPRCGKTTLLRDLIRLASTGSPSLGLPGQQVSLVDERSEVAGVYQGMPQHDLGPRTDVLDGAPKAEGMLLMLRAMSPDLLATDEIGRAEDAEAIAEAAKAGVSVIATAHAAGPEEAARRPILGQLLTGRYFERLVVLDRSHGPGTVNGIYEPGGQARTGVGTWSGSWELCSSWRAPAVSVI